MSPLFIFPCSISASPTSFPSISPGTPTLYRALALDLGGTLLDLAGRLSPLPGKSCGLAAHGVRIALASGRMTASVRPIALALGFPVALMAYNGAVVLEGGPMAWEVTETRVLPGSARDAVFALSHGHGVFLNAYSRGRLYGARAPRCLPPLLPLVACG